MPQPQRAQCRPQVIVWHVGVCQHAVLTLMQVPACRLSGGSCDVVAQLCVPAPTPQLHPRHEYRGPLAPRRRSAHRHWDGIRWCRGCVQYQMKEFDRRHKLRAIEHTLELQHAGEAGVGHMKHRDNLGTRRAEAHAMSMRVITARTASDGGRMAGGWDLASRKSSVLRVVAERTRTGLQGPPAAHQ
eukprot:45739-Rhodomonas_salina.3